ncbi:hypothetical protein CWB85_01725 [Pseudoalteromonas sp. S1727]|nr:hypothetical protein CWB85_01725 [Pseudoalteromonas sp. S1727]
MLLNKVKFQSGASGNVFNVEQLAGSLINNIVCPEYMSNHSASAIDQNKLHVIKKARLETEPCFCSHFKTL